MSATIRTLVRPSNVFALNKPKTAGLVSHVFTIGLTPAAAFTGSILGAVQAKHGGYAASDAAIIVNAFMLSTGFNSIAKVSGKRQRPAFYYDRQHLTEAAHHPDEEFISFYSGDTTWAFTLAATGTTLAYLRGYKHARWVAVSTGSLAFIGSFLRMSADMHWMTDVLVGAGVGTAVGVGLPLALHRREASGGLSITPKSDPGEAGVAISGRF